MGKIVGPRLKDALNGLARSCSLRSHDGNAGPGNLRLTAHAAEDRQYGGDWRRAATVRVFGLPLACACSLAQAERMVAPHVSHRPSAPFLVTFANPLAVKLVTDEAAYRVNIRRMDLVFCDGIALVWATRRVAGFPMARVSFDSTGIAPSVFRMAQTHRRTIAFVGGRSGVAEAAARRIRESFPDIRIVTAIDGYRSADELISAIVNVDPDVVVCGMGAPRQEAFLVALADAGWCGAGFTCGGYLDHLVDRFDFYPAIINRLNLRWLYRLMREPRRIGYRCIVEYAPFWRAIASELVRGTSNPPSRSRQS